MRTSITAFISSLRKQRLAFQSIVATIPFLIYFRDEFYGVTYVRGSTMAPTICHGDIVLIRRRDAGNVLLNILHWIGYLKRSSAPSLASENDSNPVNVDEEATTSETPYTKQLSNLENDHLQALRYRLENSTNNTATTSDTNYWFISPSYVSPLILPGHVVVYQNPFRFPELSVKRVIGVGGQRIATRTKARTNEAVIQLPNDVLIENTQQIEENNSSALTTTSNDTDDTESLPSLWRHLRRRQQQKKEADEYYDLRLPPHFIYTENENHTTEYSKYGMGRNSPVSQNLITGIAEYVIWPPSRLQRIKRQPVYETISNHKNIHSISRPRAIWD